MLKLTLTLLLTSYSLCSGYKLLLVFPFPSTSDSVLGQGCVTNLLKAGHEVTYITPYPMKNATKGLRQIEVENNSVLFPDEASNIKNILIKKIDLDSIGSVLDRTLKIINATVMHNNVQGLLNNCNEDFDAVVVEWMYSEVFAGFASVFNCPLIWVSPAEPNPFVLMLLKEHPNAYTSGGLTCAANTSFWQKVLKQFQFLHVQFHRWLLRDKENYVFNQAFGLAMTKRGGILPPFEMIKYNGSLVFGTSCFATQQPCRLPLNYIQIAGFHIDEERDPLPKNLKKIMDDTKNRVIFFSMGSTFSGLPDNIVKAILNTFSKINGTVIWQYNGSLKASQNVHVFTHVPQQAMLAHPKCVLFITNGDLLSVIEAVHFGIPIIGVPIYRDEIENINKAVNQGFARKVDIPDIKVLKAAIDDVLRNPKYREKVTELSKIYSDRPIPPGKELAFWIEHVIRTKGGVHLRSQMFLPWYDTVYLELIIVYLTSVACLCVLTIYLLKRKKKHGDLNFKKYI